MSEDVLRATVTTRDVEAAAAMIAEAYSGAEMRRPEEGRPFWSSMSVVGDGLVAFMSLDQMASCGGTMPPQSSYVVGEPSATLRATSGRSQLDATRAFLYPVTAVRGDFEGEVRLRMTQLDIATVQQIARAEAGADRYVVRFTGTAPMSAALERYWSSLVAHARRVATDEELFGNALIRHDLTQMLAHGLLRTFPNDLADREASSGLGTVAPPAAVRRAVSYLEEHSGQPVTLEQVAAAARLSPRGLQAAFRRHLGTTPLRYLRRLRLDGARQDLLAADPTTGASVADVARRWGFTHLGRFAGDYREAFEEHPGDTLRA